MAGRTTPTADPTALLKAALEVNKQQIATLKVAITTKKEAYAKDCADETAAGCDSKKAAIEAQEKSLATSETAAKATEDAIANSAASQIVSSAVLVLAAIIAALYALLNV